MRADIVPGANFPDYEENPVALAFFPRVPVALGLHPGELVEPLAGERALEPVQELRGRINLVVVLALRKHRHLVEFAKYMIVNQPPWPTGYGHDRSAPGVRMIDLSKFLKAPNLEQLAVHENRRRCPKPTRRLGR